MGDKNIKVGNDQIIQNSVNFIRSSSIKDYILFTPVIEEGKWIVILWEDCQGD